MSSAAVLKIIQTHPEGLWVREIARKAGVSPGTVCNYLYGYKDRKGRKIKPVLKDYVNIERLGGGAVTIVKPK